MVVMSHEEGPIDATVTSELEEALALLDDHFAKIPHPDLRLFAGIDILRRTRRLAERTADPLPKRYAMISNNIRAFFFQRRADGMPALLLPEQVQRKLASLSEKARALSVGA